MDRNPATEEPTMKTADLYDEINLLDSDDLLGVREELQLSGASTDTAGEPITWTGAHGQALTAEQALAIIDENIALND